MTGGSTIVVTRQRMRNCGLEVASTFPSAPRIACFPFQLPCIPARGLPVHSALPVWHFILKTIFLAHRRRPVPALGPMHARCVPTQSSPAANRAVVSGSDLRRSVLTAQEQKSNGETSETVRSRVLVTTPFSASWCLSSSATQQPGRAWS